MKKSKVTLLAEHKEKMEQKQAEKRGAILLDKRERRELQGFKARQRELEQIAAPLNADVTDFLVEIQNKYSVKIGETHTVDFDKFELIPMEKEADDKQS